MRGTDIAKNIITRGVTDGEFLVYFDPDVDGVFAGVLPWFYLKRNGKKSVNVINDNRQHGILLDLKEYIGKVKTIISVDSFVSADKVKEIVDLGFNFASFDHHECGGEFIYYKSLKGNEGVVVNNQYPWEREDKRFLSGTGVVYEAFLEMFPNFEWGWFRDLVGITLLSDVRDINSEGAREYLKWTYESSKGNIYSKYLIDECLKFKRVYSFGRPYMDRNFISFNLSPAINSLLRFNKGGIVLDYVTGKGLSKVYNVEQKEFIKETLENHAEVKILENAIAIVKVEDWNPGVNTANFIGLIANNIVGKKCDNVLCFVKKLDGTSRASFRSSVMDFNFLEAFQKLGYNAIGHKGAFGVLNFLDTNVSLSKLVKVCKESLKEERKPNYVEVRNLSIFKSSSKAIKLAEENNYLMDSDRVFIKYVGDGCRRVKVSDRFTRYSFDGVSVVAFFDGGVVPKGYLIDLSTSSGLLNFTLTETKC